MKLPIKGIFAILWTAAYFFSHLLPEVNSFPTSKCRTGMYPSKFVGYGCVACPKKYTGCKDMSDKQSCLEWCRLNINFSTTPRTVLTTTPSPADLPNKPAESCSVLLCLVVPIIAACCILVLSIAAILHWKRKKLVVCIQRRQRINSHFDDGERHVMMSAPQHAVNNEPVVTVNPGGSDSQCIRANSTIFMPTSDHNHAKEIMGKANWNGDETHLTVKANSDLTTPIVATGCSCAKTLPTLRANKYRYSSPDEIKHELGTQPMFKDQNESSIIQDDEEHCSSCHTQKGYPVCKDNSPVPVDLEKGVKETCFN